MGYKWPKATMKKTLFTIALMMGAFAYLNAQITAEEIQQCRDRISQIQEAKANMASAQTDNVDIDGFKDNALKVCEDVVQSGNKALDLYKATQDGGAPLQEAMKLSEQLVELGKHSADLGKQAEPAGKEIKNIKNPKVLLKAKKIISNATSAVKLTAEELKFQVRLVNEIIQTIKAKQ